ncbi:hypothetical protein ACFLXQ_04690 [Chloroflexota bacterium]
MYCVPYVFLRVHEYTVHSTEEKILELYQAGNSMRTISKAVFDGKVGQFYNQKIQEILEKYGEK